jgi:AraC-like DNA-binding protein
MTITTIAGPAQIKIPRLNIGSTISYYLREGNEVMQTFGMNKYSDLSSTSEFAVLSNEGGLSKGAPIKTDHYAIILCLKGSCTKTIGHFSFTVEPGTIHLVTPDRINSFENVSDDLLLYMILFKKEFLAKSFTRESVLDNLLQLHPDYPPNYRLDATAFERIKCCFEKIDAEYHSGLSFHLPIIRLQVIQLLYEMKRACETCFEAAERPQSRTAQLVFRFRKMVDELFLEYRTIKEYADQLHVTAKYLGECVKKETGESALEIIHRRILLESQYLLTYSSLSIKEITDHLGFDTNSHFSRFFKAKTGMKPMEYKQANG